MIGYVITVLNKAEGYHMLASRDVHITLAAAIKAVEAFDPGDQPQIVRGAWFSLLCRELFADPALVARTEAAA